MSDEPLVGDDKKRYSQGKCALKKDATGKSGSRVFNPNPFSFDKEKV